MTLSNYPIQMKEMIVNLIGAFLGMLIWVASNGWIALLMAVGLGFATQIGQQLGKIVINKVKSVIIVFRRKPPKKE